MRVLNRGAIATLHQDAHDKVQGLLRTVDNDYLRSIAGDCAGTPQVGNNSFAQPEISSRRTIIQRAQRGLSGAPQQNTPPRLEREFLYGASTVSKVVA